MRAMTSHTHYPYLVGHKGPEILFPSGLSRAGLCGRIPIGESAVFRLGLMLGAGGMAMAVMVLLAVFIHA